MPAANATPLTPVLTGLHSAAYRLQLLAMLATRRRRFWAANRWLPGVRREFRALTEIVKERGIQSLSQPVFR